MLIYGIEQRLKCTSKYPDDVLSTASLVRILHHNLYDI